MLSFYLSMIDSPEEQSKFTLFYTEYREQMVHAADKILHNLDDAEDAVEMVFLKIVENMNLIGEPISRRTKGLLLLMTEHMAIDIYRKQRRHPEVPYLDEYIGLHVECPDFGVLSQCIAKLPANYRRAILLKANYGLDNRELATALGVSQANAIKIHQRAKDMLFELCEKEELT